MTLKTDLNRYPYWNDYDEAKDFYGVLFKPSVAVQMRELNQLQSILQKQIERFGDNILTSGSILSGCNFQFYVPYPYVKLPDTQIDGSLVDPGDYVGKFVLDPVSGLKAYVVNYEDGFELSTPDLKTIYVNYINGGTNGNTFAFNPGNNVTIYDGQFPIDSVEVDNGGTGFSNTDQVVFTSALVVNTTIGTWTNTDAIINPITGANGDIVDVDTTTLSGKTIISYKPRNVDLTNSFANSTAWTFSDFDVVTNVSGSVAGTVEEVIGEDAQARVITNSIGTVTDIVVTGGGEKYETVPQVTIKTSNASATVGTLELEAKNFVAKVKLPGTDDTVGDGYAFGVTEGITYQQGYFQRVAQQTIIVSKYDTSPNNVAVGFNTVETIVTSDDDESLLENALGTPNEFAPGADRLKLTPELVLLTKEEANANANFFTLVEFNDGNPYKKNQVTSYSRIGDKMASDLYDSSGNFVLDAFQVTTEPTGNAEMESQFYTATIDPGQAYINGKKVQTTSNYKVDMQKGTDVDVSNNSISLNYGNYVRVTQLIGDFDFSSGATIELKSAAANYLANVNNIAEGTITPRGVTIGTAKIRSIELESGYPGTVSAVYRMYLFDLEMNAGQNFRDTRGLYYNGTYDGLADVIQVFDASTSSNIAALTDTKLNSLLFSAGVESLKNSNNSTYVYRTIVTANVDIDAATITITLDDVNEYFPYDGDLALSQMQELLVVPVEGDIETVNAAGSAAMNTTSTTVVGTSTTFSSEYAPGDYVRFTDGGANVELKRVVSVVNATHMTVDSAFAFQDSGLEHSRVFPKNVPVPFGQRTGLYANVDGTEKILTLEFRHTNNSVMDLTFGQAELDTKVGYNAERRNVSASTKTAVRNKYVKIAMANSVGGLTGPWCLGVPDAFRLRAVYLSSNSTITTSHPDVVESFWIDHNQNANFMDLSYLFMDNRAQVAVTPTSYLLVCFDYFERDNAGYFDTTSYLHSANTEDIAELDSMSFSNLSVSSAASSWEVPEVYTYDNKYYDLLNTFDFRPTAANTCLPGDNAAGAPINPSATVTLASHSKFPRPNAVMRTRVEQYLGRIDDIYIGDTGNIYVLKGIPAVNPRNRYQSNHPKDTLRLQTLVIPPYPNLTSAVSRKIAEHMKTRVANEKYMNYRVKKHTINALLSTVNQQTSQPMVYTMEDIANLERRIKDLEYYVQLSILETNITNKIIPSSLDPSLNRFKFGFFADDFSTDMYCDLNNPQYNACIEVEGDFDFGTSANPISGNNTTSSTNSAATDLSQPSKIVLKATNRLVPPKRVWHLKHYTPNLFYFDEVCVRQQNATVKLTPAPTPNTPPVPINPCVVVVNANSNQIGNAYYTSINRNQSTVYFENLAGFVTIYFDFVPGRFNNGGKFTVYNGNNQIVAGTAVAQNSQKELTTADVTFLTTNPLANSFYNAITKSNFANKFTRNSAVAFKDYGIGSGKIQIPAQSGGQLIVKAESPDEGVPNLKFLVEFPSLYSSEKAIVNKASCDPNPPVYKAGLESGALTVIEWSCSNIFRTESKNYRGFVIFANGLKPNTVHKFYLDTKLFTNVRQFLVSTHADYDFKIKSVTGNVGWAVGTKLSIDDIDNTNQTLKTDASGKIALFVSFPLEIAGWFAQDFNVPGFVGNFDESTDDNWRLESATQIITAAQKTKTYGSSGYTALVLQDATGTSVASRVFANRTPTKTLPTDPRGNI